MASVFNSVAAFVTEGKAARAEGRADARKILDRMSEAMIEEEGLLNHAQAALLLGVSVKRVGELVRLRKLTRFDFFERTYVSVREVRKRDLEELKAGRRAKRGIVECAIDSVKAGLKTDPMQLKQGGYAGPYHKAKQKEQIEERKRKSLKKI